MSKTFSNSKGFQEEGFTICLARWKCSNFVRGGRGPIWWVHVRGLERSRNCEVLFDQLGSPCLALLHQGIINNKKHPSKTIFVLFLVKWQRWCYSQRSLRVRRLLRGRMWSLNVKLEASLLQRSQDCSRYQIGCKLKLTWRSNWIIIDPGQHYPWKIFFDLKIKNIFPPRRSTGWKLKK